MKKQKYIIVANWKMNPENEEWAKKIFLNTRSSALVAKHTEVIVCPPFIYLSTLQKIAHGISLGVQDLFWEESGSFTGEISPTMAYGTGARYAIIGHSERRAMGETDEQVSKKIKAALINGFQVIVCVGEKERDAHGKYLQSLFLQIQASLGKIQKKHLSSIIIAYEPVWTIGKANFQALSSSLIEETALFIRKVLSDMYGYNEAMKFPILYGGSVSPKNAGDIIKKGNVQGLLMGRQSLERGFTDVISAVDRSL
ncbi:MAG: triose-phosphate isomerase [Patescibacteria group bacterium]